QTSWKRTQATFKEPSCSSLGFDRIKKQYEPGLWSQSAGVTSLTLNDQNKDGRYDSLGRNYDKTLVKRANAPEAIRNNPDVKGLIYKVNIEKPDGTGETYYVTRNSLTLTFADTGVYNADGTTAYDLSTADGKKAWKDKKAFGVATGNTNVAGTTYSYEEIGGVETSTKTETNAKTGISLVTSVNKESKLSTSTLSTKEGSITIPAEAAKQISVSNIKSVDTATGTITLNSGGKIDVKTNEGVSTATFYDNKNKNVVQTVSQYPESSTTKSGTIINSFDSQGRITETTETFGTLVSKSNIKYNKDGTSTSTKVTEDKDEIIQRSINTYDSNNKEIATTEISYTGVNKALVNVHNADLDITYTYDQATGDFTNANGVKVNLDTDSLGPEIKAALTQAKAQILKDQKKSVINKAPGKFTKYVVISAADAKLNRDRAVYSAAWDLLDNTLGKYAYNYVDDMCSED
ncbi:MAG: hypothetical protein PHX96_06255, partial [Candidatus Nanoarchaeia archaeon]|nr:hypothetical protein [Candidatus Nanoarchaeia archaeon]